MLSMEGPAAASTAVAVRSGVKKPVVSTSHGVPEEILNDRQLQEDIAVLPANYNFEVRHSSVLALSVSFVL